MAKSKQPKSRKLSYPPTPLEAAGAVLPQDTNSAETPLPAEPVYPHDHNGQPFEEARGVAAGSAQTADAGEEPPQAEPPSTNRGVTVTLHWLSLTFFINPARAMSHFLTEFLDIELEGEMEWSEHFFNLQRGARGYKAIFIGPHEVRFYAYPDSGVHCHLEIPGTLIEMMGTPHVIEYLKSLNDQDFDWRPTRIDVAFDNVPFSPHACYEALARGDIRTRAHDDSWDWRENKYGHTFNLGSRKSGRFIRVYDRRGPTRLEIELKEGWASALADVLTLDDHAAWIHTSLGYVRDFVDFVDARLGGSNASRAPLLPWWESFVGDVGKIRLSREADAEAHLLARTQRYLERLLPTLYVMRHGLDISLDSIVDSTAEAISDRHRRKLGLLKQLAGRV